MKTSNCNSRRQAVFGLSQAIVIVILLLILIAPSTVRAEISEPDNLLYGAITLDNAVVTAARTDVVIEARRTMGDAPIATYRMGTNPQLGDFYLLRLTLESGSPIADTNASQLGDSVFIVVRDATGVRGQTTYTFPERGNVRRTDFGAPAGDSDGNGLPDAWELANFGAIGQNPNHVNPNGQTTLTNFTTGANPSDSNSLFKVNINHTGSQTIVSFLARRADGSGYEGRARYYSLESSTNIAVWMGVAGYTNLLGNNQTVTLQASPASTPTFYRGKVWLQGP
jgi:hypothetical protein